jgi:hypothetical protein
MGTLAVVKGLPRELVSRQWMALVPTSRAIIYLSLRSKAGLLTTPPDLSPDFAID